MAFTIGDEVEVRRKDGSLDRGRIVGKPDHPKDMPYGAGFYDALYVVMRDDGSHFESDERSLVRAKGRAQR